MPEETVIPAVENAATEEVTTATESATGESNEPTEDKPKVSGGFQKRIDKLTRQNADREREVEYWRQEALKAKPVETKTETPKAEGKPKEDDFQTHAEYVEALTDWKVDEKFKASDTKTREEAVKTQHQTAQQQFKTRQDDYKAAVPDFDEVLADADTPISQSLIDEIVTGDNGPALQYFLAKNPDEATRLSALGPMALAKELGRIESRFTTAPPAKVANVTKAPAPPSPVGRTSSTTGKDPYKDDMSQAEYKAWRRKENPNFDR